MSFFPESSPSLISGTRVPLKRAPAPVGSGCVHTTIVRGKQIPINYILREDIRACDKPRALCEYFFFQVVSNEADRGRSRGRCGVVLDNFNDQVGSLRISKRGDADLSDEVPANFATVQCIFSRDLERPGWRFGLQSSWAYNRIINARCTQIALGNNLLVEDVAESVGNLKARRILLAPGPPVCEDGGNEHYLGDTSFLSGVYEFDGADVVDRVRGRIHFERIRWDKACRNNERACARERGREQVYRILDYVQVHQVDGRRDAFDTLDHCAADSNG